MRHRIEDSHIHRSNAPSMIEVETQLKEQNEINVLGEILYEMSGRQPSTQSDTQSFINSNILPNSVLQVLEGSYLDSIQSEYVDIIIRTIKNENTNNIKLSKMQYDHNIYFRQYDCLIFYEEVIKYLNSSNDCRDKYYNNRIESIYMKINDILSIFKSIPKKLLLNIYDWYTRTDTGRLWEIMYRQTCSQHLFSDKYYQYKISYRPYSDVKTRELYIISWLNSKKINTTILP